MSLADKLQKLKTTKEAIRTSINNKGGTLTESDTFSSYSTAIDNIKTGGGENPLQYIIDNNGGDGVPSCRYLFYYYKGTSLDSALSAIDTSNVKNMEQMFYYCTNLTSIPQLDTSKVTNMQNMFYYCTSLTSIPQLDTSNVTDMSYMFYNCPSLTSIPQLDTSKVTNMQSMFCYCRSLTTIPQLDTSKVTNMQNMFYYCTSLTSIGLYGFTRSIDITNTALEHDAIVAFLNQAGTAYNSSQRITMGSTKLALLSDEEKAIATNKGWTLA